MRHTGEDAAHTPDTASAEPVVRVRPAWTALLSLATLALFMAFMTPIQILLPLQLEHIDPAGKHTALSWVTGAGALVAMVANPLAGALSDRTVSRFGVVTLLGGLLIARVRGVRQGSPDVPSPAGRAGSTGRIVGPDR